MRLLWPIGLISSSTEASTSFVISFEKCGTKPERLQYSPLNNTQPFSSMSALCNIMFIFEMPSPGTGIDTPVFHFSFLFPIPDVYTRIGVSCRCHRKKHQAMGPHTAHHRQRHFPLPPAWASSVGLHSPGLHLWSGLRPQAPHGTGHPGKEKSMRSSWPLGPHDKVHPAAHRKMASFAHLEGRSSAAVPWGESDQVYFHEDKPRQHSQWVYLKKDGSEPEILDP